MARSQRGVDDKKSRVLRRELGKRRGYYNKLYRYILLEKSFKGKKGRNVVLTKV
jgi:hypothetical protein